MANVATPTKEKALKLLGDGIPPEQVAGACGVTVSVISQLLSEDSFKEKVQELRYEQLRKHNETDNIYDDMEKKLQQKFNDMIDWGLTRPMEVLKAMKEVNSMQRRGASAPQHVINQQTVVPLILPVQIINQFSKNSTNQVIKAGEQELITIQSGQMATLLNQAKNQGAANVQTPTPIVIEASPGT